MSIRKPTGRFATRFPMIRRLLLALAVSLAATPVLADGGHGDHNARQGGLVFMVSNTHYEVVLDRGGLHKVFVSDGMRVPVPASTFKDVKLTVKRPGAPAEDLVLAPDAANTFWSVQGQPVTDEATIATITYTYADTVLTMDVALPPRPTAHGGIVQPIGDGQAELVATRAGALQLWLLDAKGVVRPVAGVKARLKVAVASYPEVVLQVEGDHLAAQGTAFTVDHADAILILEAPGQGGTARFTLHLEAADAAHEHEHEH